ncbi:flagellar motor switch protein FliN [Limnohabitans sp. Rim11]|jgi:flagellar motor switch protein FliN/FliY|uniref:flagellar motor switch protein FliN n=1 Tax=Limnohabitans sp. Rim11 TaxID=1100719 RepID=UPI000ACBEB52|nr:flagellar motor switch protein FliN [Limnohabitans sp. Rim11]
MDGLSNLGGNTPADDLTRWLKNAPATGTVQKATFENLESTESAESGVRDVGMIMDLPVKVMVELGRTKMSIGELLALHKGSVIELNVHAGDPLDLVVNGCLIAQGEVVIVNDRYGIRLTDIISPSERLRKTSR